MPEDVLKVFYDDQQPVTVVVFVRGVVAYRYGYSVSSTKTCGGEDDDATDDGTTHRHEVGVLGKQRVHYWTLAMSNLTDADRDYECAIRWEQQGQPLEVLFNGVPTDRWVRKGVITVPEGVKARSGNVTFLRKA